MPVILDPRALLSADRPPVQEIRDALWNMCSEYIVWHRELPRYVYLNERLWKDDLQPWMTKDMEELKLKVVTHPDMPPDRISVHHEYLDAGRIARWHRQMTDEDGLESGRLSLQ